MAVLNKRTHGTPPGSVYIGRGGKWGNPFRIGTDGDRNEVCDKHKRWLWQQIKAGAITLEELAALDGKDLVCFCAPARCHGHTLEAAARWAAQQIKEA